MKRWKRLGAELLKRVPLEQRLRLLGVRAGTLIKVGEVSDGEQYQVAALAPAAQAGAELMVTSQLF